MQDSLSTLPEPASSISLREYGEVLRRRRAIILQTFVVVLVMGVLVTLFTPPTYHATSRLLLDAPSYVINSVNSSDPLSDLLRVGNQYSMGTQVELLQTPEILSKVQASLGGHATLPTMSISVLDNTQIIQIDSEGDNPQTVADAPNSLMAIFVEEWSKEGTNGGAIHDALNSATANRDKSLAKMKGDEDALRKFQQVNHLQEFEENRAVQIKSVQGLTANLEVAAEELAVLQKHTAAVQDAMGKAGKAENNVLSPLADPDLKLIDGQLFAMNLEYNSKINQLGGFTPDSPLGKSLAEQLSMIKKRRDTLEEQFKERNTVLNPQYVAFQNELLQDGIQQVGLMLRVAIARQRLQAAKELLDKFPNLESTNEDLQRTLGLAKKEYEVYSSSVFNLQLRYDTLKNNASILQKATPPTAAIKPKKAQNILFSGLLGLFLGLCLALLQELFDDRINNPEEAERVLRIPTLGHVPMIEEEGLRLIRDISTFSPLMEAYRTLRTNINFAAVGGPLRSLVVTSSVPAEGKSTTVANLAMAMALDNKRVIVVDADLRRPSLHKLFKKESSPGLTDILVGTHTMEDVIRDTNVPGVRVIPAGSPPPNPAELLGSAAMGHFLTVLEQNCDIVVFDSPPTLAVADAVVLASRTDGVALVIGYGETKKTSTRKAIEVLSRANANILGTVLNRIEGPSSGYYYGKYYVPTADRGASSSASRDGKTSASASAPMASTANRDLDKKTSADTPMIPAPADSESSETRGVNNKETDDR